MERDWTVGGFVAVFAIGWTLIGCGTDASVEQPTTERGLQVRIDDGGDLHGSYVDEPTGIEISLSAAAGDTSIDAWLELEDKAFSTVMDLDTPYVEFDAPSLALTPDERQALQSLSRELQVQLAGQEAVASLAALAGYLAEAPDGHVLVGRTTAIDLPGEIAPRSISNDGISCIKKGSTRAADYSVGSTNYTEWVVVGSNWGHNAAGGNYNCMGRCGPACQPWYAVGSSWTLDCLEHDVCSYRKNATGGSSDPNCGDEYDEAQDDWLAGIWVGCGG